MGLETAAVVAVKLGSAIWAYHGLLNNGRSGR